MFFQRGVRLGRVVLWLGLGLGPAAVPALHAELSRMQEGEIILGQRTGVEGMVGEAEDVALDLARGKAYVVDPTGGRVLRFALGSDGRPLANAEAVLGKANFTASNGDGAVNAASFNKPSAVCVEANGRLWVADAFLHRVLRFDRPWDAPSGQGADGVLGQPSLTASGMGGWDANELRQPGGLAVDPMGNLYVSDTLNNRILRFDKAASKANGASADAVLGQSAFGQAQPGTSDTRLRHPEGLSVSSFSVIGSPTVWLWVADTENHRVLRFSNAGTAANGKAADKVLGQADFTSGTQPNQASSTRLRAPRRVRSELTRVWVADSGHHRVLGYNDMISIASGAAADKVLGQSGFSGRTSGSVAGRLFSPGGLAVDASLRLWVCDAGNQRLVWHNDAPAKINGADADGVLGADSLAVDPAHTLNPGGLAVDPATGKLFVSDIYRHRVLRYADHRTMAAGAAPEAVLGQANFTDGDPSLAAQGMNTPHGLWVDNAGRLWVADTGNHRVLRFDQAATRPSGAAADQLLGQPAYGEGQPARTAAGMNTPAGVVVDATGRLWVSDALNHRVLRFDNAAAKPSGAAANAVLGQADFTSDRSATVAVNSMNKPIGLHLESNGRLWVVDSGNSRVLRFDGAAQKNSGAAANGVLGQAGFTSALRTPSATGLDSPTAAWMDAQNRLWVADRGNIRLVRFDAAASRPNGAAADFLLGQEDWGFNVSGDTALRLNPTSLFVAQDGALWVADFLDFGVPAGRVLRYTEPSALAVRCGRNAQGRFFITFPSQPQANYRIEQSTDLKTWTTLTIVASDGAETTWTQSTAPSGTLFFRVVETSSL